MTVYFIRQVDGIGPIKIGYTKGNVIQRLKAIQNMCPVKIELIRFIPGGKGIERGIHNRFKSGRLHGEWFAPTGELLDFMETLENSTDEEIDRPTMSLKEQRFYDALGQRICKARKERKLSQIDIASSLQVSQQLLSLYENGKRRIPPEELDWVCKATGKRYEWFINGD